MSYRKELHESLKISEPLSKKPCLLGYGAKQLKEVLQGFHTFSILQWWKPLCFWVFIFKDCDSCITIQSVPQHKSILGIYQIQRSTEFKLKPANCLASAQLAIIA